MSQREPVRSSFSLSSLWRDIRFIRVALQVVFLAVVLGLLIWLANNARLGLQRASIQTSFDFLSQPSSFQIDEGFVSEPHKRTDSFAHAFLIGFLNTLRVIAFSLALSTLLGLVVGVARLSTNWLIRSLAAAYVEVIQNTPLLLQLIFLYSGVLLSLPPIKQAIALPGPSFLSIKGLATPSPVPTSTTLPWLIIVLIGLVISRNIWRTRRRVRLETGQITYAAEAGLGLIALIAVVSWLILQGIAAPPFTISYPRVQGFSYVQGEGSVVSPEFVAIVAGLTLYTGAFIAEIVRAGIQSVPVGQWEAARSQGFSYFKILRLIVLPQALRVMIPPLTNQYLNLSKNSSLGAAVGFADLFGIARTIQQAVPVVPVVIIVMGTYLLISLIGAAIMNVINARFQLKAH
jgi:general L-amino acid transport system permease protein